MRKMIALLIACVLLGSLAGCGKVTVPVEIPEETNLFHTDKLTFNSKKEEIEQEETLKPLVNSNENKWYVSDTTFVLPDMNENTFRVLYCFASDKTLDVIMYLCDTDNAEDARLVGRQAKIYKKEVGDRISALYGKYNVYVEINEKEKFSILIASRDNVTGISIDGVYIEIPANGEEEDIIDEQFQEIEEKDVIEENPDTPADTEGQDESEEANAPNLNEDFSDALIYSNATSDIRKELEELKDKEEFEALIENWTVSCHSFNKSCDATIEFQAAADVRVGTVSAIRNIISDMVLEEISDISKINVRFVGIGNYTFTVGEGWDREASSDDHE